MKYKLTLCFDGRDFCGWQVQENAPTVQRELCLAAEKINGRKTSVTGCSRTDSGVHAESYVCHLELDKQIEPARLVSAMNFYLPNSIAVLCAQEADEDFHARYSVISKEYNYLIWNSRIRSPFWEGRAFHYPIKLDIEKMRHYANMMTGEYDACCFMASGSKITDTIRRIEYFDLEAQGELIRLKICANGFLYNMVRIMTGTLIDLSLDRIKMHPKDIIASKDRKNAGFTVPAQGLYLVKVNY